MAAIKSVIIGNGKLEAVQAIFQGSCRKLAFTATSSVLALSSSVSLVRVVATQNVHLQFAASATATTSTSIYLPANIPEYFCLNNGDQLAAIRDSADGNLFVCEAVLV